MEATLVTIEEAREHLRVLSDYLDGSISRSLYTAEQAVLRWIETGFETGWTSETVPPEIKTAILMYAAHLLDNTGEDDKGDPLTPAVRSMLRFFRDPVLA